MNMRHFQMYGAARPYPRDHARHAMLGDPARFDPVQADKAAREHLAQQLA